MACTVFPQVSARQDRTLHVLAAQHFILPPTDTYPPVQEGWALPLPHTPLSSRSQSRAPSCSSAPWGPFPGSPPPEGTSSELTQLLRLWFQPASSSVVLRETKKIIWLPSAVVSGTYSSTKVGTTWASVSPYRKEDSWHTGRWEEPQGPLSRGGLWGFPLLPNFHISFSNSGKARPLFPTPTPPSCSLENFRSPAQQLGPPCGAVAVASWDAE